MLCQHCQQRDATIHLTKVVNGVKEERYLCGICAASLRNEEMAAESLWGGMFDSFLPGPSLFGYPYAAADQRRASSGLVCPQCGETERELRETGLLGCAHCYETFRELLFPVFRRAQGHTQHVPATERKSNIMPGEAAGCRDGENSARLNGADSGTEPLSELDRIRRELRAAVEKEDYECAARLRDAIRALEAEEKTQ